MLNTREYSPSNSNANLMSWEGTKIKIEKLGVAKEWEPDLLALFPRSSLFPLLKRREAGWFDWWLIKETLSKLCLQGTGILSHSQMSWWVLSSGGACGCSAVVGITESWSMKQKFGLSTQAICLMPYLFASCTLPLKRNSNDSRPRGKSRMQWSGPPKPHMWDRALVVLEGLKMKQQEALVKMPRRQLEMWGWCLRLINNNHTACGCDAGCHVNLFILF